MPQLFGLLSFVLCHSPDPGSVNLAGKEEFSIMPQFPFPACVQLWCGCWEVVVTQRF